MMKIKNVIIIICLVYVTKTRIRRRGTMLKKILVVTLSMVLLMTAFPIEFNAITTGENPTVVMENDEMLRENSY